ncbi:CPBP family intramembrane glutamic endopeptidase [Methylobacter sp.]|uniref:CPBP family intramembrane glutamic endopeptidase n=1 Tax=Methylobacter sp. TaxID=2051955 RepID=UPI0024876CAD|nr:CPBP family intramembrane glutamic endopeptidase [Methylobacter sp.]MDI1276690.1 CPBP family intramembrane metalloprotease [Methylobacter sp.]MDI1357359.1 CPBP family intramembrane metalloprotease [Methylobacter sp.]
MDKHPTNHDGFFKKACFFEAALILVAVFLGWIADINPFADLHFSESAIAYGVIGTIPLFLLFLTLEQMQAESLLKIKNMLFETLGSNLHRYHWTDLLILASIAGLSEELLFRGVIQPWMESSWGLTAGLVGSNIIFGLAHAVTPLYAVLAALVGIYLGLSMDYAGDRNLLLPIVIHGLYDFLAFIALLRAYRASRLTDSKE